MVSRALAGRVLGPVLFTVLLLSPLPEDLTASGMKVAAVAALMATWWISEAIPIPVTALLPVVLFPLLGVMSSSQTTSAYANHLIYLFMGGFMIAVTMERWSLHRRIALHTIRIVGATPERIVLGFMLATAFLSMWISNTATAMMMMPIALAVIGHAAGALQAEEGGGVDVRPGEFRFGTALMLGIAYAASIGGTATLIGTPPNAILAGIVEKTYGQRITFAAWLAFATPLALVFLLVGWLYLTRIACRCGVEPIPGGRALIRQQLHELGPMIPEERRVLVVFALVALAWVSRGLYAHGALKWVHDSTIAIAGVVALFLIPAPSRRGEYLLDWATAVRIPWDIILLFGGGFALAQGFSESGLTAWLAAELGGLEGAGTVLLTGLVALLVVFLTELTSNTATATLLIPVMGALASATGMQPLTLMVTAGLCSSYAFMLPVATPPNAIVFGSRYVRMSQMVSAGVWMNLIGCALVVLFVLLVLPRVMGSGPA